MWYTTAMKISVNGKFVRHITLRGDEPEFHYGYGVFETLRTYHEKLFEVPAHLKRLHASAKLFQIPIHQSNVVLTEWLQQHCRVTEETRVKLIAAPQHIYILSTALHIPHHLAARGTAVTTYAANRLFSTAKNNNWVQEYLARTNALQHGYFDALLVSRKKRVTEAACGNVFFVKNNILYTPNADILFGVTRTIVLRLAKSVIPIRFATPTLNQLYHSDECFITKSGTGIVPVVRINQKKIGNGKPGPVTKELIRLFDEYVEIESQRTLK